MVFRSFLRIFFFTLLFLAFLLIPKKALAAPYAYFTTAGTSGLEGVTLQYRVFAGNDSNINRVSIHVSPTNCANCWTTIADSGVGGVSGTSVSYPPAPANWTFNTAGTYYVVTNVYASDGGRCTGNTNNGGLNDLWGNPLSGWAGCDVGYASKPLVTVTISPRPPSSIVMLTNITLNPHNIYDLCVNPNPNPDTMLLEYIYPSVSIQNNGGEGFNSYYIYISKLAGDAKPTNGVDNGAGWWRYGPTFFIGPPVTPDLFGAANGNGFTGLVSGNRQLRVVLYNTNQGCSDCNGYPAVYDTQNISFERDAPNYTGDWPSPNSGSPKLRTTTPSSTSPYDPAGIQGMTVTLESRPLEDVGGYGVDRVDYWVGNLNGDNAGQIKAGNPLCAPSPPYLGLWFGDICKNNGPFNCPSFTAGNGQGWFINSGTSVTWNTNGFTTGTRVIAANLFDHPADRNVQNFRTYTGNGAGQNFARVDYNLMPPHAPTASFSPYPPGGIINAYPGQAVTLPTATANDAYGYLVNEELWIANQSRTQTADIPCNAPNSWLNGWCSVQLWNFTKRASYSIVNPAITAPSAVGLYDVAINAKDQFGEKCTGDPKATTFPPQWPPLWTNCGAQDYVQINVQPPNTIIGTVYVDSNGDGLINDGGLTYNSGASINTPGLGLKTTDGSGYYSYTSVVDGNYSVTLSGIANYKITSPCSGLAAGAPCTAPVVNASGGNTYIRDFAVAPVYTISGNVFIDSDRDGVKDASEGGYNSGGVNIVSITGIGSVPTNANGDYSFTNVTVGTYAVTLTVPLNYYASTANPINGVIVPPNKIGQNFGIAPSLIVSGNVFKDTNKDGIKNGAPVEQNYGSAGGESQSNIRLSSDGLCSGSVSDVQTVSGAFTFNNVLPGDYFVCYLGSPSPDLPAGYSMTTVRTRPVTVVNINITGVNFGLSNLVPWFQCIGADCRNDNGLVDKIPSDASCGSYASLSGSGGTPGIVFSGDSNPDFGSGQASQNPNNWMAGTTGYPELFTSVRSLVIRTSYNYMLTTANQNGITPTDLSAVCSLSNCTLPGNLANGVYKADGDLTLLGSGSPTSYTFPSNKNFVILVNGDLTVKTRLIVPPGSTVTFSSSRDIIIDKTVEGVSSSSDATNTNINGMFSADRSFIIQGNGSSGCGGGTMDKRLNIGGSVVVNAGFLNGSFVNERDICSDSLECPAYSLIERPDFILNAPEFIKHPNFLWQEVAP